MVRRCQRRVSGRSMVAACRAPHSCSTGSSSATPRRSRRSSRRRAPATTRPILVAAALFAPDGDGLLARAGSVAATTRDRQLVAIAAAHLRGERDLVDALARDHLVDHPDSVLVAWIAGASHIHEGAGMNPKLTAALLILAAVLANVGFTALGSIFNYPDVLDEPAGDVLAALPRRTRARSALVHRAGAVRRADGPDRDRRRAALVRARDADRGAGRDRRRRRAGDRPDALADPRARLRADGERASAFDAPRATSSAPRSARRSATC